MTDKRKVLTQAIMELLDDWKLSSKDKVILVGLPEDVKARHMEQYRVDKSFPETEKVNEHLIHLVGIADALRTTYPRNIEMGTLWLKKIHKRLNNQTPMHIMTEQGLAGIKRVRGILDCTYEWNMTGSSQ